MLAWACHNSFWTIGFVIIALYGKFYYHFYNVEYNGVGLEVIFCLFWGMTKVLLLECPSPPPLPIMLIQKKM
jgi:hypothetical protein